MKIVFRKSIYFTLIAMVCTSFADTDLSVQKKLIPSTRTIKPIKKNLLLKDLSLTPKATSFPHPLAPINPNINLDVLSNTDSYRAEKMAQPAKPAISWLPMKRDSSIPLIGVMQRDGFLVVSIYGNDHRVPADVEQKIRALIREPNKNVQITGKLVRTVLAHVGISASDIIFLRTFKDKTTYSLESNKVNTLTANFLMDGDRPLTEILVRTELKSTEKNDFETVGLAWIGSQDRITRVDADHVKWEESPALLTAENLLAWYKYVYPNSQLVSIPPTTFRKNLFPTLELYELQSLGNNSGPPEEMLGYAVRTKKGLFLLREPYSTIAYGQRPSAIWAGKLLDGFESVLYVSSTAMGDCGSFVLVDSEGNPTEVPVRCTAYGC